MQNSNMNRCGLATASPPGSSRLACFPNPEKGFVSFVGFVTNKKRIKQQINKIKV
jgi:hypothetical protein